MKRLAWFGLLVAWAGIAGLIYLTIPLPARAFVLMVFLGLTLFLLGTAS